MRTDLGGAALLAIGGGGLRVSYVAAHGAAGVAPSLQAQVVELVVAHLQHAQPAAVGNRIRSFACMHASCVLRPQSLLISTQGSEG